MIKKIENISNIKYDIGIIGAGPAGISLATNLSKKFKIAVIEGGDFHLSEKSQSLYKGKNIGDKYFRLDETRLRLFGGSSNHWGGMCRPIEEFDYSKKKYTKLAYWPLKKYDLDKYLDRACEILEIENNFQQKKINDHVAEINFKFSTPVNFNSKYKKYFLESKNIDLFINTNALFLKPESKYNKVVIANFNNDKFILNAKKIILCMGGIENSRFLLISKIKNRSFLKNQNIGKYWMEHPHYLVGDVILRNEIDYSSKPLSYEDQNYFILDDSLKRKKEILNCSLRLDKFKKSPQENENLKKLVYDLSCVAPRIGSKMFDLLDKNLICGARLIAVSEQEPNINSEVLLDEKNLDIFNLPTVNLRWKKNKFDINTIKTTTEEFAKYFAKEDLGRIAIQNWLYSNKFNSDDNFLAGNHHMGGCRMSLNSETGVVDTNLELHHHKNIYVCGSSVFPSSGHSNPTLTIVQLSLRLSNYLNYKIS